MLIAATVDVVFYQSTSTRKRTEQNLFVCVGCPLELATIGVRRRVADFRRLQHRERPSATLEILLQTCVVD